MPHLHQISRDQISTPIGQIEMFQKVASGFYDAQTCNENMYRHPSS